MTYSKKQCLKTPILNGRFFKKLFSRKFFNTLLKLITKTIKIKMNQIKKLEEYLIKNLLPYKIEEEILSINNKEYYIVQDDSNVFEIILPEEYGGGQIKSYVYEFGGRWYIQNFGEEVTLSELIYIGNAIQKLPTKSFLGIHSGYELMNGVSTYKSWVKKAKFLGTKTLAICEKSSLSGVIAFQVECQNNDIKPIIGIELPVVNSVGKTYTLKLYCINFQGWINLLKFNTILNVDGKNHIEESFLEENRLGLYVIVDTKTTDYESYPKFADFYQLDTVKFLDEERDTWYMNNLEKFILGGEISPISITDAYYLEVEDVKTREVLWDISKAYDDRTDNQFFKTKDTYASELIAMFEKGNKSWISLFKEAVSNEGVVSENCTFTYGTNTRHLPKYKMTDEEAKKFTSSEDLFLDLVKTGFKEKGLKDPQKYIERLKVEIEVLKKGDVIDYFLSLHDIIRFTKDESILTGIGRGSAGGSLVAYLLGIIKVDPLDFDLLFERFLNSGRMGIWEERPLYSLEMEDGTTLELPEGTMVKILRKNKETYVLIHEVEEEDEILKY